MSAAVQLCAGVFISSRVAPIGPMPGILDDPAHRGIMPQSLGARRGIIGYVKLIEHALASQISGIIPGRAGAPNGRRAAPSHTSRP
jgi:hypothetical protein